MYWNPEQYLQFEKERTQPAIDLANRIPQKAVDRVLDVGCGPGNSTKVLAERLPGARVLGIDRSLEMIEVAKEQHPALQFMQWDASQDLEGLGPSFDVIFSNACIQWIPDHPALLGRFMDRLNPGGILAVQVPMNNREPIHQIIQECISSPRWKSFFPETRVFFQLQPGEYAAILAGWTDQYTLWETVYYHRMPSHRSILEWYRGTGLRPYLQVLPAREAEQLELEILARLEECYPKQKNGEILFRFPRLFFLAQKPHISSHEE